MESKPFDSSFTKIRRKKNAVNDETWIKKFLHQAPYGVLATAIQDQPFVSTKLFVYDEQQHVIYLHSADRGRAPDNVRANPQICFTATQMGRLLPGMKARDFGVEYASVVVFGHALLVQDQQEMIEALQMIMDKYAPICVRRSITRLSLPKNYTAPPYAGSKSWVGAVSANRCPPISRERMSIKRLLHHHNHNPQQLAGKTSC